MTIAGGQAQTPRNCIQEGINKMIPRIRGASCCCLLVPWQATIAAQRGATSTRAANTRCAQRSMQQPTCTTLGCRMDAISPHSCSWGRAAVQLQMLLLEEHDRGGKGWAAAFRVGFRVADDATQRGSCHKPCAPSPCCARGCKPPLPPPEHLPQVEQDGAGQQLGLGPRLLLSELQLSNHLDCLRKGCCACKSCEAK